MLHERFDQTGAGLRAMAALAGAGDGACFGNVVVVAAALGTGTSPAWRDELHALQTDGVGIGASQLRLAGGWSIKFVTSDGVKLKQTLSAIRRILAPLCPHLACDARKL